MHLCHSTPASLQRWGYALSALQSKATWSAKSSSSHRIEPQHATTPPHTPGPQMLSLPQWQRGLRTHAHSYDIIPRCSELQAHETSHLRRGAVSGSHQVSAQPCQHHLSNLAKRQLPLDLSSRIAASCKDTARLAQEQAKYAEALQSITPLNNHAQECSPTVQEAKAATNKWHCQRIVDKVDKRQLEVTLAAAKHVQNIAEAHQQGEVAAAAQDNLNKLELAAIVQTYELAAVEKAHKQVAAKALRVKLSQEMRSRVFMETEERSKSADDRRKAVLDAMRQKLAESKLAALQKRKEDKDMHALLLQQLGDRIAADHASQTRQDSAELSTSVSSGRETSVAATAHHNSGCKAINVELASMLQHAQASWDIASNLNWRLTSDQAQSNHVVDQHSYEAYESYLAEAEARHEQVQGAHNQACCDKAAHIMVDMSADLAANELVMKKTQLEEIRRSDQLGFDNFTALAQLQVAQKMHIVKHFSKCVADLKANAIGTATPSPRLLTFNAPTSRITSVSVLSL